MTGQNGGSNISPADGAKLHQQWTNNLGGSFTIGAPAVAGWDGGVTWLKVSLTGSLANASHGGTAATEHAHTTSSRFIITVTMPTT